MTEQPSQWRCEGVATSCDVQLMALLDITSLDEADPFSDGALSDKTKRFLWAKNVQYFKQLGIQRDLIQRQRDRELFAIRKEQDKIKNLLLEIQQEAYEQSRLGTVGGRRKLHAMASSLVEHEKHFRPKKRHYQRRNQPYCRLVPPSIESIDLVRAAPFISDNVRFARSYFANKELERHLPQL